ncbi:MAG TPA: FmdB family zinc ribbon protein [Vicinamibacterales bacterium]|nr:FmdB family zinc ribbon protein [Vicinamibacterales bacterium]
MPLYEYQCDACNHRFERIQKFSDPPVEVCPACGGSVRKLISSPAIQFKGSGWYITDYAKKPAGDGAKSASSESSSTSDSKTTSDSKSTSSSTSTSTPSSSSGSSTSGS